MDISQAVKWYPVNYSLSSDEVIRCLLTRLARVLEAHIPGDVVEMGCHAGDTSVFFQRMIYCLDPSRTLHLYDSFQGLPEKSSKDNPNWGDPGSVRTARQ